MTAPGSSGRPERAEPRVLRNIELAWISLDPAAVPYEQTPPSIMANDRVVAFPAQVPCPQCDHVEALPGGGSDDELERFWAHLCTHSTHPLVLVSMWATAMGRAR